MRRRAILRTSFLAVMVTGCGLVPSDDRPVPAACEFPEGVRLAFAGHTTLAALGIPAPGRERDPVYAWITAEPISFPSTDRMHRAACTETDKGAYERSAYPGALDLSTP